MDKSKVITLKIPSWIGEEKVMGDVKRLLEEKYGVVSIESLREKFKVALSLKSLKTLEGTWKQS